ncbi:MAG: stage 0 sporulation family protein [Flavobacteriales bacterium Tduv]
MSGGCSDCGKEDTKKEGCRHRGNCSREQCGKLDVFDWLANIRPPRGMEYDFIEVRFKNDRKDFYKNSKNFPLQAGDWVTVEAFPGHDIGMVTLTGELVRVQMRNKKALSQAKGMKNVYRKASEKDLDKWKVFKDKEAYTIVQTKQIIKDLMVPMKLCDIEYQGDGGKAIFYYTAEDRVDFRQLIKVLAQKFRVRIEMRQIGYRQEAAKIGGIGSCGRELCCTTWLTDFRSVNTAAARYQQLSINTQKLAGQCGKLKCCLNYELDTYLEAIRNFPDSNSKLNTENGIAQCTKIDVFRRTMWFAYTKDSPTWYKMSVDEVLKIIQNNLQGKKAPPLEKFPIRDQFDHSEEVFQETNNGNVSAHHLSKKKKRLAKNT